MGLQSNTDVVNTFLQGHDPMERIVSMECDYNDEQVSIIYNNADNEKRIKKDDFKPFVWAKNSVAVRMFDGNRAELKSAMKHYGIGCKALQISIDGKEVGNGRLANGYKLMFYATKRMSYQKFLSFFQVAGTPIYERKKKETVPSVSSREFLAVSPIEQYMIATGRRLFKGYDNYNDTKRMLFDLETEGLNPHKHHIDQIGIRTNKGFERIIGVKGSGEEKNKNELNAIIEMVKIIAQEKPDIIAGHNSEKFDWDFIIVRCDELGVPFEEITKTYLHYPIYKKKKETVLKLGGEVEYYRPTIAWGFNIIDSLHAVRRAQAIDSSMKSANLKYVTKYLNLNKNNRVYVNGNMIGTIWLDDNPTSYAFNNENGDYYKIKDNTLPLKNGYVHKSGQYIVERYLLDDIWETDKVELTLNESNFLISKMLPTTFQRACTMGTAGIWKLIMLAWCYENNLAVAAFGESKRFTGGLSRLLKTGYADRVVKLDYNSLYPSIILTWNVSSKLDITNSMLMMLEYVLTQREKYKELKAVYGAKGKKIKAYLAEHNENELENRNELLAQMQNFFALSSANDKKQLPLKILANSFFGSYGAPNVFPFGDNICAEMTTCIGRQALRLMIYHFSTIGQRNNLSDEYNYTPIVGDTDGFNFQMPFKFRYTDENPYISNGGGRNSVKDKAYVGVEADVCEFEDMYLYQAWNGGINKMGLGIDEFVPASINFSRKNYADLLDNGKTKKVGNTIKSRKMSGYIEKFLDPGIDMLLNGQGQKFLESYYDYISKIYNYQIPLRDIATKGKIKKTISEYIADCKTTTKSGSKKSRQAWYELVINKQKEDPTFKVDIDDTIYFVNTGLKKSDSDVKRVTHQYVNYNGEIVELTNKIKRELLLPYCEKNGLNYKDLKTKQLKDALKPLIVKEEDEIIMNCQLIPNSIVDADEDIMCGEEFEYNVVKYIEQFNNRIKPLLVCFSKEIRPMILITNPDDKPYFTEEQCKLVAGEPNKDTDQDTYEQLMRPERKEIEYWLSINQTPPFVKECNIDWDGLVNEYLEIKKAEDDAVFQEENKKYLDIIESLTDEEYEKFENEDEIPKRLQDIVHIKSDMHFYFNKLENMTPSTGGYIFDDLSPSFSYSDSEAKYEAAVNSLDY